MTTLPDLLPARAGATTASLDPQRLAIAAHLARYRGVSRAHVESDLRAFLAWCLERDLAPRAAQRAHLELYVGGCRRSGGSSPRPSPAGCPSSPGSTARASSTACWSTRRPSSSGAPTCRPNHPPSGSPTSSCEALLTAGRDSANPNDFALVCLLGLLGLRIFEATGANINDLGEEHGHRVLRVNGKGGKLVLVPLPPCRGTSRRPRRRRPGRRPDPA